MTILLLGAGPRLAWVRSILEPARAQIGTEGTPVRVVEGPPSRELLSSLAALPVEALVLVDHFPFAAGPPADAAATGEAVRGEAQRAVFAVELARRAERTLALEGNDAQAWAARLAGLLPGAELLARPDRPCPPSPGENRNLATPLLSTYLEPLFAAAARPAPLALAWPREAFLDGDAPGEPLPVTVEVAGRARILAYGPYLPLPVGHWRATAFLGFSPDIDKLPFILEADTGGAVVRGFFEVEHGGIFTLELDFRVADALHPVEMRLISQDSALEGQVALIELKLEYVSELG